MGAATVPACELGHARWQALGTSVVVRVSDPDPALLARARAGVQRELDAIDLTCSRFRADSELSRLNSLGGRPVRVSALLLEAVELALRAAELTDGDVDPTVGRALELAGYDRDWQLLRPPHHRLPRAPSPSPSSSSIVGADQRPRRVRARVCSGWWTVSVNARASSVRLPRGIRLDLGASAKAWAADRAAQSAAADTDGCGVLVSLGGDIATCGESPPEGWRIRVSDDHRSPPDAPGQTVCISGGGLATSSTAVRRWHHDGRDMHHIIDPRTDEPARSAWRTVSVAAASCAEANIAATAAIVRGAPAAAWLCELGLPARLVDHEDRAIVIAGWPAEQP
jgi:thiamine biosynthesis lipoprotein